MLRFTIATRLLTLIAMELSMVIVKWGFPSMGGSQKWLVFVRENPTNMDDLGVSLFQETTK